MTKKQEQIIAAAKQLYHHYTQAGETWAPSLDGPGKDKTGLNQLLYTLISAVRGNGGAELRIDEARRAAQFEIEVSRQLPEGSETLPLLLVLAGYVKPDWAGFTSEQKQGVQAERALTDAEIDELGDRECDYWEMAERDGD